MRRFFAAVLLFIPMTVSANTADLSYAGTDRYLREQSPAIDLTTELVTEKRQAFSLAEGEQTVSDPIGDIVTRYGTSSTLQYTWGDITSAELQKEEDGSWVVRVKTAEAFPPLPSNATQILFLADQDGDASNNDLAGIHGSVDAEFIVKRTANGWVTDYRWFNKEADFWAIDKETNATFSWENEGLTLRIPSEELSAPLPNWRVVVAISNGDETHIDAVPGSGFPPSLEASETPAPQTKRSIALYGIPFILLGIGLAVFGWKRRS